MGLTPTGLTISHLMTLPAPPAGVEYELSDGVLIVVGKAGYRHERVKSRILKALYRWSSRVPGYEVFAESMFSLGEHTARMPDAAVVSKRKLDTIPETDIPISFGPDLAVEVVSLTESARDAETKVSEYLQAGVDEIWQVFPDQQLVRVRRTGNIQDYTAGQTLTSVVLPGFELLVVSFFVD